jgi:Holliday junction resolvase-like predicted endonuclease
VAAWYVREGYEIIARNWRCTRGELDIVAWRHGVLAVCEVKARRNADFADPFEAITPHKMQRVRRATAAYIASLRDVRAGATAPHNLTVPTHIREIRFDAAAVVGARVEVRENVA